MGAVDEFLFGNRGGLDKKQKKRLEFALAQNAGDKVSPDFLNFAHQTIDPVFGRARQANAASYANADAAITSGGRTQADIGLAGQEAGALGQMTQEELQRRKNRYLQILGLLSQPKPASGGFLGEVAPVAGYALGGGFSKAKT